MISTVLKAYVIQNQPAQPIQLNRQSPSNNSTRNEATISH